MDATQLSELSDQLIYLLDGTRFPALRWTATSHAPTTVERVSTSGLPQSFQFAPTLVQTLIEPALRAYLAAGISTESLSVDGVIGSKLQYGRRAAESMAMDCEMRFTGLLLSSLLSAVNETIWERHPRNYSLRNRSYGMVGLGKTGRPDIDLCQLGQTPSRLMMVAVEPQNTLNDELARDVLSFIKTEELQYRDGAFEPTHSSTIQEPNRLRALRVINQIYAQFAEQPSAGVSISVLLTSEVAVLFQRTRSTILVSDLVFRHGPVTQTALCTNFFTLFLGIAVMSSDALSLDAVPLSPCPTRSCLRAGETGAASQVGGEATTSTHNRTPSTSQAQSHGPVPNRNFYSFGNDGSSSKPASPMMSTNNQVGVPTTLTLSNYSPMILDATKAGSTSWDDFDGAIYPRHLYDMVFYGPVDPHVIHWTVPVVTQPSPPTLSPAVFHIQDRIGQGGVWNAFSADGDVLRVACIDMLVDYAPGDELYAAKHAVIRRHVGREISALIALAGLPVVPTLKGVWATANENGQYWAVLTAFAGAAVASSDDELPYLPKSFQQRILDAYAQIHSRGIRHRDPKAEHWRVSSPSKISIIDYSHCEYVSNLPAKEQEELLLIEMSMVRGLLNECKGDWTKHPYSLDVGDGVGKGSERAGEDVLAGRVSEDSPVTIQA